MLSILSRYRNHLISILNWNDNCISHVNLALFPMPFSSFRMNDFRMYVSLVNCSKRKPTKLTNSWWTTTTYACNIVVFSQWNIIDTNIDLYLNISYHLSMIYIQNEFSTVWHAPLVNVPDTQFSNVKFTNNNKYSVIAFFAMFSLARQQ